MKDRLGLLFFMCLALIFVAGCASIGTPSGGPRDEQPPRFVRSKPYPGAVNVSSQRAEIEFDEYITVKDAFQNVVVSPTSTSTARVSASGKKVIVQFPDTLRANTTYTIDFGNAIRDNNEGNVLENFTWSFSTGSVLDTLRISGIALGARDLEPQQGILVGVHSVDADTAFRKLPLERVAKTDDRGRFSIRGLSPGTYRVFALADINNDFKWDNPAEDIAFMNYTVSPTAENITVSDTIYNMQTAEVDSVVMRPGVRYLPNDLLLSVFNVDYKPQYLASSERPDSGRLVFAFNAPFDSLPSLKMLNTGGDIPAILERTAANDTLTYWLTDSQDIKSDTIRVVARYMRNKELGVWEEAIDTLTLVNKVKKNNPKKPDSKKKDDKESAPAVPMLTLKSDGGNSQEVYKPRPIEFAEPLKEMPVRWKLEVKSDTVWMSVPDKPALRQDTLNPRLYFVDYPWEYETGYRVTIDSIAAVGISGLHNAPFTTEFITRKESDYGALSFTLSNYNDSIPAFVELLNSSDKVVRTAKVENHTVVFKYLQPTKYFARFVEDVNGNGIYDTGDYDTSLQPEAVSYYPKKINLKKNWDMNLSWDVNALPVDLQKPSAVKKNKPTSNKRKKQDAEQTDEEDEDETFDPTANPFDPNQKKKRSSSITSAY